MRRARYRLWVIKAVLAFAVPSLVVLGLLGRWNAIGTMPVEFGPAVAMTGTIDLSEQGPLLAMMGAAAVGGMTVGTLLAIWQKRRGRRGPMIGDVGAVLPRHRGELAYAAALSVTAGVTEELFFRLALPLTAVLTGVPVPVTFIAAILLFGAAHRYQGWIGILATTAIGALFAAVYLASGSLWVAMAFHAFIDLNGLVIRPVLTGAWRREVV